jgi:hypothetical protein
MDCYEKRQKKGYLFMTGDEPAHTVEEAWRVGQLFGTAPEADVTIKQVVQEAQQTFHCFFLIPHQGRYDCAAKWRRLLGKHVIQLQTYEDTCLVSAVLIGLTEGTLPDLAAVEAKLAAMNTPLPQIVRVVQAVKSYARSLQVQQ